MTITYKGRGKTRSGKNSKGIKTYTHTHLFETTSSLENEYHVGSHASVPLLGSVHPDDAGAWVESIDVDNTSPIYGWTVTIHYSSERELATDPTNDPAIIRVSTEQFQREAVTTNAGLAICNSAGDPYDPPLMMDDSRRVIHISKNMAGHPSWLLDYADVVNSDSFTVKGITYTAGQGKVQRVSIGEQQVRNGVPFVVVDIEIHLQKNGWPLFRMDAGFREFDTDGSGSGSGSGDTRRNIRNNGDAELPATPVPLEGGVSIPSPSAAVNVILAYDVYATNVFSALPMT